MQSILKHKLFLIPFLILFVFVLCQPVHAKEKGFDNELFLAYDNTEDETGIYTSNLYSVGIALYETTVGYGDYPYRLTNFFERRTHLDFIYSYWDYEAEGLDETTGGFYQVKYSFISEGSPLLFDLGIGRFIGDGKDVIGDYGFYATAYDFAVGYYITPNSVAKLILSKTDYRLSDDTAGNITYDENNYELTWQHVRKIGAENYISLLLDVEAVEVGSYSNSNVGGGIDYYVNRKVGFGFAYTAHRGDYAVTEGETVSLRASAFIDQKFGFEAQLSHLYADLADSDEDNIFIQGIARF